MELSQIELEKRLEDVKSLIRIWQHFYQVLSLVFQTEEEITPDQERKFQQIKTIVAEKHDSFMRVIDKDYHIGQNMLSMVKRVISLFEFRRLSRLEVNKLLIEWHDANILLQETLGNLEYQLSEVGRTQERARRKASQTSFGERVSNIVGSKPFKWLVTLVILGAVVGVTAYYWDQIQGTTVYRNYIGPTIDKLKQIFKIGD